MSSLIRNAALVAALVSIASLAPAQTITGVVSGTVTDPSGQAVPGAAVTLINEATNDTRTGATDVAGSFVFPALLPGAYTVKIEAQGFQTVRRTGNQVTPNERLSLGTIQLAIGSVAESVTVSAEGAIVQTASAEGSALLTTRQLATLAQKGRDVIGMLNLMPGVETRDPAEAVGGNYSNVGTPRMGGLPSSTNTVMLDGAPATDLGSAGSTAVYAAFDSAQEVKVLLNSYQAEYGRAGGAMVNIVTKGGTNEFHGSAYWYKRHEMFNANDFFNNRSGIAKKRYRYLTEGLTVGGPVSIPKLFNTRREKLFFFYMVERNPAKLPLGLVQLTMPTVAERNGDFSQTLDTNNKLMVVNDPTTHTPFPGNIVPSSRIDKSGQALLNVFVPPNQFNRALTLGAYNYQFQESLDQAKLQHVFRIDYRATDKDTIFFRGMTWGNSNHGWNGSGGSAPWPMVQDNLEFLVRNAVLGYTRVIGPTVVNEFNATVRRVFLNHLLAPADQLARIQRDKIGFTVGQFHPEINPQNIIPQASFSGVSSAPSFGGYWSDRYPAHRIDSVYTLADGVTMTRGAHTLKGGFYFERDVILSVPGFGQTWMGNFSFNRDTNNPLDANHPFANALLGVFQNYQEPTTRLQPKADAYNIDWYVQDSWKVSRRLTLELGLRMAYATMYRELDGNTASLALGRWNPNQVPVLYQPTLVGKTRMALNPITGQTTYAALIGGLVPGTGDPANGMVTSGEPNYPRSFVNNVGEMPQPRFGLAWDVFGNGRTAVRAGFGMYNSMVRNEPQSNQPPISYTPSIYYGTFDTLLNATGVLFPGSVSGWDANSRAPGSYNMTFGIQQQVGFGTVVEAKYVGTLGKHLAVSQNLNTLPYGTRFLPTSLDTTTNKPLPDTFLSVFRGYTNVTFNQDAGSSNFHALEVSAGRRFARNLEFTAGWTWAKWLDYSSLPMFRPRRVWSYGLDGGDQTHKLVLTYTYSLPGLSRMWSNPVTKFALDNWQVSGITMFASGQPSGVGFTTVDGTDMTGGGDGQRINVTGSPALAHGDRGLLAMFNTSVFARPGKNDPGNAPITVVRGPGRNNWDFTIFKNFPIRSERRVVTFRWELYNALNHTQFSGMDTTARFDASGNQINSRFGQATSARAARIMQASLRFQF